MGYVRSLRRPLVATLAVAVTVVALALPAGATQPTGNAAAIKAYAKASAKINKAPFFTIEYKSLYFLKYLSNGGWQMYWGVPKTPKGYTRVNATEIIASSHNKNIWEEFTFTYACPGTNVCFSTLTPIRFYLTKKATYWTELTGANYSPGCWNNAAQSASWITSDFTTIGDPTWYPGTSTKWATASFFDPAVTVGATTTFTSTYKYTVGGAKATEVDTLDDTTGYFTHSNMKIGSSTVKGKKYAGYTYSQVYTVPKGTIKPPKTSHLCS